MGTSYLAVILILLVLCLAFGVFLYFAWRGIDSGSSQRNKLRNLVDSQRDSRTSGVASAFGVKAKPDLTQAVKQSDFKPKDSRVSLKRKLVYANWAIPAVVFRVLQIVIGIAAWIIVHYKFNIAIQFIALISGMFIMNRILERKIKARFKAFDKDYPQFLQSLVGLLKTGMNPMTAIRAAADGMEESSIVRAECELMLERLRYGVTEDQSIGAFGEEIDHPEIELFVQALLLSRKVGGTLSDTLERLSRQVRRRQYFREQAVAAVGMQRGSIWFIIAIMCALELYLFMVAPNIIRDAIAHPLGWQAYQFGFLVCLTGVIWVRKVTQIKV